MLQLKDKKDTELHKELTEKRVSLRKFRFDVAGSKIKNIKEARNLKKEIARVITELNTRITK